METGRYFYVDGDEVTEKEFQKVLKGQMKTLSTDFNLKKVCYKDFGEIIIEFYLTTFI